MTTTNNETKMGKRVDELKGYVTEKITDLEKVKEEEGELTVPSEDNLRFYKEYDFSKFEILTEKKIASLKKLKEQNDGLVDDLTKKSAKELRGMEGFEFFKTKKNLIEFIQLLNIVNNSLSLFRKKARRVKSIKKSGLGHLLFMRREQDGLDSMSAGDYRLINELSKKGYEWSEENLKNNWYKKLKNPLSDFIRYGMNEGEGIEYNRILNDNNDLINKIESKISQSCNAVNNMAIM